MTDELAKSLAQKVGAAEHADATLRKEDLERYKGLVEEFTSRDHRDFDSLALAGLVVFFGFLAGRMPGGRCRLYVTLQMSEFVEVAEQDVVMTKPVLESAQFPLGGTYMWVKRGADVQYTRVTSRYVQAELLSGALTQASAPSTGTGQQDDVASPNGAYDAYIGAALRSVKTTGSPPTGTLTCEGR
jgi:hypothetical protein